MLWNLKFKAEKKITVTTSYVIKFNLILLKLFDTEICFDTKISWQDYIFNEI